MKFDKKEIENSVVKLPPPELSFAFNITYGNEMTAKENMRLCLQHKGVWMPATWERLWFCPRTIPDNIARAFIIDGRPYDGPVGGKDMFGIEWEYVPNARGSIVRPGNPTLKDVRDWKEVIKFPDIDSWPWEENAEADLAYISTNPRYINLCIFTGWFERLISFMDFGPAAYALMNKKTQPYVKELFDRISDMWIELVDKAHSVYGSALDGFTFHDDWGSQGCPFFNVRTTREMLVPYMKRVTDHIHELGYTCELHSCGKIEPLVECIIEAGWDSWNGMTINDYHMLYPKYGDKLVMDVPADCLPKDATKEQAEQAAVDFMNEYGQYGCSVCASAPINQTAPDFFLKLYELSRIAYDQ